MKHIQTIWRLNPVQSAADRESWLGSLVAAVEADFSICCSFVVLPEHRQRVLTWLATKASGPHSVQELPDGRIAVTLGTRQDAVRVRAIYRHCVDQDVIVANRPADEIRGFIAQLKGRLAS
jgi:hypothetical protein